MNNELEIIRYSEENKQEWDNFIDVSINGTFLFKRDFMEYHKDRFDDFSLMIYRKGKLFSCLPANVEGDVVHSHQGLTYGGFVFRSGGKLIHTELILDEVLKYLRSKNISDFYVKQIPIIFQKEFSNEMQYWFWRKGFDLYRKDTILAIDYFNDLNYSKSVNRRTRRGIDFGLEIREDVDYDVYWDCLNDNLNKQFNVAPVHSLKELTHLKSKFPDNIKQYNAYFNDQFVSGITLFISGRNVHCQYSALNEKGKEIGAQTYLFAEVIKKYKNNYSYFDFGNSNLNDGRFLNSSLVSFKESFGARTIIQEFYKLKL